MVALQWGASEGVMFIAFLFVFAAYLIITARPWRFVPALRAIHSRLGFTPAGNCGVFFGNCKIEHVEQINALVAPQLSEKTAFRTRLYQQTQADGSPGLRYAVVEITAKSALPIVITPWLVAALFALTVVMCVVSAIGAIFRVVRIDPATVFMR